MTLKEKLMLFMLANDYDDKDVARILGTTELAVWRLRTGTLIELPEEFKYKLMMMLGEDV